MAPTFAGLLAELPSITFAANRTEATPAVRRLADSVTASFDAPTALVERARDLTAAVREGTRPDFPTRLVQCEHNHVVRFALDRRRYVYKLYSIPAGWLRECVGRGFAREAGLPAVEAHVWAERVQHAGAELYYTVALDCGDEDLAAAGARTGPRALRDVYASLGRWARRYNDAATELPKPLRPERREFSVDENNLFDMEPLWDEALLGERGRELVASVSADRLRRAGDGGDALVHNDLATPGNVHVTADRRPRLHRLLDFEHSHVGFRAADLVWFHLEARPFFDAFVSGYGFRWRESPVPLLELWGKLYLLVESLEHPYLDRPPCSCPHLAAPVAEARVSVDEALHDAHRALEAMTERRTHPRAAARGEPRFRLARSA